MFIRLLDRLFPSLPLLAPVENLGNRPDFPFANGIAPTLYQWQVQHLFLQVRRELKKV
jgi:hypothetical protein